MTLTRSCVLFLAIVAIASLTASMAGHPEHWWQLALLLGSAAAWYLTGIDPLKGLSLLSMALRAALLALWSMRSDVFLEYADRYRVWWAKGKSYIKELE